MAVTAIHPGEHLAEELEELGMSAAELARNLDVPTNRVTGILNGQRAITGDTPCVWLISSAPVQSFGLTCKACTNCAGLRRSWGNL